MPSSFLNTSIVNAYSSQICDAFAQLGRPILASHAESLACFLLKAMGSEARDYHRPEHPLEVSKNLLPVGQLAALFHDLVYVQVDPTWESTLSKILDPFIPHQNFNLNVKKTMSEIQDNQNEQNKWLKKIVYLFGFESETHLMPTKGLNEFLSAIVFYQKMHVYLQPEEMLRGICCIEATIHFRKKDTEGRTPFERLVARIKALDFGTGIDFELIKCEYEQIIQNDLHSFGAESTDLFLSNTWDVMVENYPAFRNSFFNLSDYRKAIFGNIAFLSSLEVAHMYGCDLKSKTDAELIKRTEKNITVATDYMKAIAATVTLVEAIAIMTGGDAPFELFFGAKKKTREHAPVNMDVLVRFKNKEIDKAQRESFEILKNGRTARSRFDHQTSTLSAYVFQSLSPSEFEIVFNKIVLFHQGKATASECMAAFDQTLVVEVIELLTQTALSRKNELEELKIKVCETLSSRKKIA